MVHSKHFIIQHIRILLKIYLLLRIMLVSSVCVHIRFRQWCFDAKSFHCRTFQDSAVGQYEPRGYLVYERLIN